MGDDRDRWLVRLQGPRRRRLRPEPLNLAASWGDAALRLPAIHLPGPSFGQSATG